MEFRKNIILIIRYTFLMLSGTFNVAISTDMFDTNADGFLISTKGCKIPAFPLISNEIKNFIGPSNATNCSENIHLLDYNLTHIWVIEDSFDFYNILPTNNFYCCYQYFYAVNRTEQIIYGNCIEFTTVIEATHEFTRVECFYLDTKIYNDFFLFPKFLRTKVTKKPLEAFNVLLFGIESMSRMNFLRMMPRTSQFLKEKGSIQLLGYNKVGDNSFPNLFPLLFGKSFKYARNSCVVDNVINDSDCVVIWTKFKEAGYHTALGSDSVAGLLEKYEYNLPYIPTDFYLQPFLFESRNIFKNTRYSFHQCLRNKFFYRLLLNWSAELLEQSSNKLFGIFWQESITHENFNPPRRLDDDHYNFLKRLEDSKVLDNSIVVMFSDHGMRYGEVVQTKQGQIENRLPLFEIIFPKKIQDQFQLAFNNFKQNRYLLTSPYDIHETLLDIVHNKMDDYKIKMRSQQISHDISKISLFLPIPKERTCESIGISETWCTCQENEHTIISINDDEERIIVANYLIRHINRLLRKQTKCHHLRISKIFNATITKDKMDNILKYWIVLETSPGGGIFDGTLDRRGNELYVADTITRLNLYRYSSQCIEDNDDIVKMYCTCK